MLSESEVAQTDSILSRYIRKAGSRGQELPGCLFVCSRMHVVSIPYIFVVLLVIFFSSVLGLHLFLKTLLQPCLQIPDLAIAARVTHSGVALEAHTRTLESGVGRQEGEIELLREELD